MSENDVIVSEQSSDPEETPEVEANASDAGVDAVTGKRPRCERGGGR